MLQVVLVVLPRSKMVVGLNLNLGPFSVEFARSLCACVASSVFLLKHAWEANWVGLVCKTGRISFFVFR